MLKTISTLFTAYRLYFYGVILIGLVIGGWKLYDTVYDRGYAAAESVWTARHAKDNAAWQDQLYEQMNRVRHVEWEAGLAQNALERERQEEREKHAKDVADLNAKLRSGAIRLHDPYATPRNQADCNRGAEGTADSTRADQERGTELSTTTAEFLAGEADRADGVVMKFNRCVDELDLLQRKYGTPE